MPVYKTFDDLHNDLLQRLHDSTSLRYRFNITAKYIQLKCTKCGLFAYWFKNIDGIEMKDLFNGDGKKNFTKPKGDINV